MTTEAPPKTEKHVTASIIKDADILATLNKSLPVLKEGKVRNGYWAMASVEDPGGDEEGDIIVVKGIEADLQPESGRYIPLLASHMRKMPNGQAAEIGRIERLEKTTFNGHPALAMYFTFALDEAGNPIDDLVKSYYDRYRLNYSNSFSVGMKSLAEPERMAGGYKFPKTKLYEVSAVSIPANAGAIGLTRSKDDEDGLKKAAEAAFDAIASLRENLQKSMDGFYKTMEDRLDKIESAIVDSAEQRPTVVKANPQAEEFKRELQRLAEKMSK